MPAFVSRMMNSGREAMRKQVEQVEHEGSVLAGVQSSFQILDFLLVSMRKMFFLKV